MTPHFLFVPGWAMEASLWDGLRAELGVHAGSVRAPGYFELPATATRRDPPLPDAPVIAVGHSLGVMQVLEAPPPGLIGLVAINGFSRFTRSADHPAGVAPRFLHRMMRQLDQDAGATAAAFRARCGLAQSSGGPPAAPVLRQGLELLCHGDGRAALRRLMVPVLSLAATGDAIVPPGLSVACFGTPLWFETGGHLLPLTHAAACARALRDFAGGLA